MGKKGSWLSAIKRLCASNSKKKPEAEKKNRLKHGGGNRSFIPHFREPSSIEKILGEVDQQNLFIAHPPPSLSHQSEAQPQLSEKPQSPPPPRAAASPPPPPTRAAASPPPPPRAAASPPPPRAAAPPPPRAAASPPPPPPTVVHQQTKIDYTVQQRHLSATRIQAAYRGYVTRRKVKGVTGLVRLQGVVKGQHVKRQTVNAMKQMQLLVRLQTQIQSRRMQTIENQALKRQPQASQLAKNNNQLEMGDEDWDDSLITKEEREARLHRKMESLNKRERAMAYAQSHQLWKKSTPKSAQNTLMGYPWWWNWLDRQPPSDSQPAKTPSRQKQAVNHLDSPVRPPSSSSSRSMAPSRTRQQMMKLSKARGSSGSPYPMKDDDSLMSCPAFSVPNYMSPTVSAKAKARPTSNPKDRMTPGTPGSVSSQRRFSFPVTPNSTGGSGRNHHKSPGSVGDFSVDSAFSLGGRKPFNRFV